MNTAVKIIVDKIVRRLSAVLNLEHIDRDHMPYSLTGTITNCGLVDEHALHSLGEKHLWVVGPGEMTRYSVEFDAESFAFTATRK